MNKKILIILSVVLSAFIMLDSNAMQNQNNLYPDLNSDTIFYPNFYQDYNKVPQYQPQYQQQFQPIPLNQPFHQKQQPTLLQQPQSPIIINNNNTPGNSIIPQYPIPTNNITAYSTPKSKKANTIENFAHEVVSTISSKCNFVWSWGIVPTFNLTKCLLLGTNHGPNQAWYQVGAFTSIKKAAKNSCLGLCTLLKCGAKITGNATRAGIQLLFATAIIVGIFYGLDSGLTMLTKIPYWHPKTFFGVYEFGTLVNFIKPIILKDLPIYTELTVEVLKTYPKEIYYAVMNVITKNNIINEDIINEALNQIRNID